MEGFAFILLFGFYLLPVFICNVRKTEHQDVISLVNLLLGWTVLGWFAALIWAIVETPRARKLT